MNVNNSNNVNNANEEKDSKKGTNHFTVTIRKQHDDLYAKTKKLSQDLGCPIGDIVWYSLAKMFETKNEPKQYGLR